MPHTHTYTHTYTHIANWKNAFNLFEVIPKTIQHGPVYSLPMGGLNLTGLQDWGSLLKGALPQHPACKQLYAYTFNTQVGLL